MLDLRKIISEGTGVRFRSPVEMTEMLQMCDELHITWGSGMHATGYKPDGEETNYIRIDGDNGKLYYGSVSSMPHAYCKLASHKSRDG